MEDQIVDNFEICEQLCLQNANCVEFLFKDRTTHNLCELYSEVEEVLSDNNRLGNIRGNLFYNFKKS